MNHLNTFNTNFPGLAYFGSKNSNDKDFADARFLAYTLHPSPFPRSEFEYAIRIQKSWNQLFHMVANRFDIIHDSLKRFKNDSKRFLFNIYFMFIKI